jgi:hypothetical protein
MGLKLERGLELILPKIEANYHSSSFWVVPLLMIKENCSPLVCASNDTKITQFD